MTCKACKGRRFNSAWGHSFLFLFLGEGNLFALRVGGGGARYFFGTGDGGGGGLARVGHVPNLAGFNGNGPRWMRAFLVREDAVPCGYHFCSQLFLIIICSVTWYSLVAGVVW
ncbi:hypothetical protein BKA56DRAFT_570115 [Ilyonectria sp. MPI-CAGE-AT-0026]|nr:hypothetical protein BKA56DRAFT_570115 [Ilyonectria sp. MPI-CAGE-AT-0026]